MDQNTKAKLLKLSNALGPIMTSLDMPDTDASWNVSEEDEETLYACWEKVYEVMCTLQNIANK